MESQIDNYQVDEPITLEQAKQELSRLREFQRRTYDFLHIFCNYDIKESLIIVIACLDLIRREPLTEEQTEFLAAIGRGGERIRKLIDAVRDVAGIESGRFKLSDRYQPEKIDLRPILAVGISHAQEKIEWDNVQRARYLREKAETNEHGLLTQVNAPIELATSIPDDLPLVWGNIAVFRDAIEDMTWFITLHHQKVKVTFEAGFDNEQVYVHIGCLTYGNLFEYVLKDFQEFEFAPTFLAFNALSLVIYNSWQRLKVHDGQIHFQIHDNSETHEPSKTTVTIILPRYKSEVDLMNKNDAY